MKKKKTFSKSIASREMKKAWRAAKGKKPTKAAMSKAMKMAWK